MKKLLCCAVTAALLAGAGSGFAAKSTYTDSDSGFRLTTEETWMKFGGKDFYGLSQKKEKQEADFSVVCAIPADKVEAATGEKFTTDIFLQKFKELQLLERNEISPEKAEYALFKPDTYTISQEEGRKNPALQFPEKNSLSAADRQRSTEKDPAAAESATASSAEKADKGNAKNTDALALFPKEMLKNASVGISTEKQKKIPYVYLHFVDKGERENLPEASLQPRDVQLAITSQNNILYTVLSVFPLPDLKTQKSRVEEATPFTKKGLRNQINDDNKAEYNSHLQFRKEFIKGLSYFAPAKDVQPFGFDDAMLGGRIRLPEHWAYFQVSEADKAKDMPVKATFSAPWHGMAELIRTTKTEVIPSDKMPSSVKPEQFKVNEALLFASARTKEKDTFAQLFEEPLLTKIILEQLIQKVLDNPKVKEVINFKNYTTTADFNSGNGSLKISGNGILTTKKDAAQNALPFQLNLNAVFTKEAFGMAGYVAKEDQKFHSDLENIESVLNSIRLSNHK